jgi:hypothetical protein
MKRCGVNRLPEADKNQPHWQPFETVTEYGHIHMDVKYLTKLEGIRSYLYVAIDRMTRYVYVEVLYNLEPKTAAGFVERFTKHFPYKLKKLLLITALNGLIAVQVGLNSNLAVRTPLIRFVKKSRLDMY